MKKLFISCLLLISISAISQNQKTYSLNLQESVVHWTGSYLFQFAEHNGTVTFKSGNLITKNGSITGGNFVIDMHSISNEQYEKNTENGPIGHLKNDDFFDVEKYPEASLELTKVTYYSNTNEHRFEGNLKIKNISNPIMIKAMVDEQSKTVNTKFKIDRKEWGINYNSSYKDSTISDAIEFDVTLVFK